MVMNQHYLILLVLSYLRHFYSIVTDLRVAYELGDISLVLILCKHVNNKSYYYY